MYAMIPNITCISEKASKIITLEHIISRNFATPSFHERDCESKYGHISGNENARIYFNILRVHCSRLKNVRSHCYDKMYALLGCSAPCLKSRKQRELLVM